MVAVKKNSRSVSFHFFICACKIGNFFQLVGQDSLGYGLSNTKLLPLNTAICWERLNFIEAGLCKKRRLIEMSSIILIHIRPHSHF